MEQRGITWVLPSEYIQILTASHPLRPHHPRPEPCHVISDVCCCNSLSSGLCFHLCPWGLLSVEATESYFIMKAQARHTFVKVLQLSPTALGVRPPSPSLSLQSLTPSGALSAFCAFPPPTSLPSALSYQLPRSWDKPGRIPPPGLCAGRPLSSVCPRSGAQLQGCWCSSHPSHLDRASTGCVCQLTQLDVETLPPYMSGQMPFLRGASPNHRL